MLNTTGIKFDKEKPDYSLVPFAALDEVVKVLTYGAKKYDRYNWQHVEDIRYQAAAMRHFSAYMQGEKLDPESNIEHLAHMACSILFLLEKSLKDKNVEIKQNKFTQPMYNSGDMLYNSTIRLNDVTPDEWTASAATFFKPKETK